MKFTKKALLFTIGYFICGLVFLAWGDVVAMSWATIVFAIAADFEWI